MNSLYASAYQTIYSSLIERRSADENENRAASIIKDSLGLALESTLPTGGPRLRDDARVLIFILFNYMIIRPMLEVKEIKEQQIRDYVQSDLVFVLQHATPDTEREISGHAILEVIHSNWKNLKLSSLAIWG